MSNARRHPFRGKTRIPSALESLLLHAQAAGSAFVLDDGSDGAASSRAESPPLLRARREEGRLPHRRGTQRFAYGFARS